MPKVRSLSDFNRNQAALIDEISQTKEPLYLTRNGRDSVVVMDSQAFDDLMSLKNELRACEMRVYSGLMRGYEELMEGRTHSASSVHDSIRQKRGWV